MMIHFFSRQRDSRHEAERLREILEFKYAVQVSVQHAPAAKLPQFLRNLLFRKFRSCHEKPPLPSARYRRALFPAPLSAASAVRASGCGVETLQEPVNGMQISRSCRVRWKGGIP